MCLFILTFDTFITLGTNILTGTKYPFSIASIGIIGLTMNSKNILTAVLALFVVGSVVYLAIGKRGEADAVAPFKGGSVSTTFNSTVIGSSTPTGAPSWNWTASLVLGRM